jgi:Fic family protein
MAHDPRRPYDALPALPPASDVETKAVLKRCLSASRALAELKGAGGLIPDQAILINAIPLQEAKLSSEIENIVTTQDALFKAALDESRPADPQTKEVLRYRTALRHGYEGVVTKGFRVDLLLEVCSALRGEPVEFRKLGEDVEIRNRATGEVHYTPPSGGPGVREKLVNLEDYLVAKVGADPLIRMAVGHYQFEAIHPFADGNGRTGRILNILYLLHSGLLSIPVLYLSRYLIQQKPRYYHLLRDLTGKGNWEEWVLFILQGVEETATWTTGRIVAIRDLLDETVAQCRRDLPKVYSKELIELVFRQPYCKIAFVVDAGIAQRQTASVYLQELERVGILKSEQVGRERVYLNPRLLEVLRA